MHNHQFGTLLSEGLLSVARRRKKTKARVEQELHEQLSQAGFTLKASTISGWCRGIVPQDSRLVALVVRYCVRHGRVDRPWAESMLTQARYHNSKSLLHDLFPSAPRQAAHWAWGEAQELTQQEAGTIEDPLLPVGSRWLIGRDALLQRLRAQVCAGESPLALHGLPGVGKTSLVLALAHDQQVCSRFPDGVLWAGLGRNPHLLELLSRWGRLLGLDQQAMSTLTTLERATEAIRMAIGKRRMLLLLDDAWTLEDALACLVGGPACGHLITTRFPELAVQMADPAVSCVPELDEKYGVHMLERLAPTVIANAPEEARALVQRVGGLPLALTLVGKYLQVESQSGQPRRISAALDYLRQREVRLHLSQPQTLLLRQRHLPPGAPLSLDASIGVSYQSLSPRTRAVLLALSIFPPKPNTFSEEAALHVAATTPELLDALLAAGLLESSGPGRYTMHQTIADFAQLRRHRQQSDRRFIMFFMRFLEAHTADCVAVDQETCNCLAALDLAGNGERQVDVAQGTTAITPCLLARGLYALAERYLLRAHKAALALGEIGRQIMVMVLRYLGETAQAQGNYPRALALTQEGVMLAHECGEYAHLGGLLHLKGKVLHILGDIEQAEASLREGLELTRAQGDLEQAGMILSSLAALASERGDSAQAAIYLEEGLAIAHEMNHRHHLSTCLRLWGDLRLQEGRLEEAKAAFNEALDLAQAGSNQLQAGEALFGLARVAAAQGDTREAVDLGQRSLDMLSALRHAAQEQVATLLATLQSGHGECVR